MQVFQGITPPLRKVSGGESAGSKETSQAGDFQCKVESLEDGLASPPTPQNKIFNLDLGSSPAIHPEMGEVVLHPPFSFHLTGTASAVPSAQRHTNLGNPLPVKEPQTYPQ